MLIADVIGHIQAKKVFYNALSENRVAHAYLISGPEGVGKTTLAKAFAAALLCSTEKTDACGICSVCRRIEDKGFPDFYDIIPAGNHIKIEQVREIQKAAKLKPYEAKNKAFLINRAESMTTEAANCLLKILEEPPAHTVFFLTAVNLYNLLPTVISRCQLIPLSRVPEGEIEKFLMNRYPGLEGVSLLAALSGGLPGKAVELAENGLELRDRVIGLAEKIQKKDINELMDVVEELEKNKDSLHEVLQQLLFLYRDRLIWAQTGEEDLIINRDKISVFIEGQSREKRDYLIQSIEYILEAINQIKQNINLRLVLEVLMLRLAKMG